MNNKEFNYGDIVRILKYNERDINAFGRIVGPSIFEDYYLVSNMNMPFYGTLANQLFHKNELKKRE